MSDKPSITDAINAVRFGDPVKAIQAFNAGAAAAGGDDSPLPPDSVYETTLADGTPARFLMVEPSDG